MTELPGVQVLTKLEAKPGVKFALAFGTTLEDVESYAGWVRTHTEGDAVIWFAYPKQSSKRYRCEFNRDTGWAAMGDAGFEAVRQVSIDEDWSALRFRRTAFVQTLKRDPRRALSAEGKSRTRK